MGGGARGEDQTLKCHYRRRRTLMAESVGSKQSGTWSTLYSMLNVASQRAATHPVRVNTIGPKEAGAVPKQFPIADKTYSVVCASRLEPSVKAEDPTEASDASGQLRNRAVKKQYFPPLVKNLKSFFVSSEGRPAVSFDPT